MPEEITVVDLTSYRSRKLAASLGRDDDAYTHSAQESCAADALTLILQHLPRPSGTGPLHRDALQLGYPWSEQFFRKQLKLLADLGVLASEGGGVPGRRYLWGPLLVDDDFPLYPLILKTLRTRVVGLPGERALKYLTRAGR